LDQITVIEMTKHWWTA